MSRRRTPFVRLLDAVQLTGAIRQGVWLRRQRRAVPDHANRPGPRHFLRPCQPQARLVRTWASSNRRFVGKDMLSGCIYVLLNSRDCLRHSLAVRSFRQVVWWTPLHFPG